MACGSTYSGPSLTFSDLQKLWVTNGGDPLWAPVAAGVALAESGGTTQAANTCDPAGGSFGLWQINGVHSSSGNADAGFINAMYDPNQNAAMAVAVSNNGRNWGPWQGDAVASAQLQQPGTPLGTAQIVAVLGAAHRSLGGASTGSGPSAASQDKTAGTPAPGDCDDAVYLINVSPYHFLTQCQARAMFGAILMGVGALGSAFGIALIAKQLGLAAPANVMTKAARKVPGPVGVGARLAGGSKGPKPRAGQDQRAQATAYEEGRRQGLTASRDERDEQERREGFGRFDQPGRPDQRRQPGGGHRRPRRQPARERTGTAA